MELKQLKSHLWEAPNILRGSAVDRTDWKGYIQGLSLPPSWLSELSMTSMRLFDMCDFRDGRALTPASGRLKKLCGKHSSSISCIKIQTFSNERMGI